MTTTTVCLGAGIATAQTPPAAPNAALAPQDRGTVMPGVTAGGLDLSGLTLPLAQARLESALAAHVARSIVVSIGGKRYKLYAKRSELALDSLTTAKRAVRAKKPGDVTVALAFSRPAVEEFVAGIAKKRDRAARDATMRITLKHISVRKSRTGISAPQDVLAKKIADRLATPGSSSYIRARFNTVRAAVNTDDLRGQRGGTVLTIDKRHFKLRLFKHLKFAKSYAVAVGQPAYPTPSGRFDIQNKQINPVWSVPNSPWAGELQGTTVDGGSASNPLKARWMGITNGVGVHGTGEPWTVGTAASHGCIRMRVPDVIALYKRVPVGTPVLIK